MSARIPLAVSLVCLLAASLPADDWPQWRGPGRDGVWRESGIIAKFDDGALMLGNGPPCP